jgi:hypothetical protein
MVRTCDYDYDCEENVSAAAQRAQRRERKGERKGEQEETGVSKLLACLVSGFRAL